ncbi:UNVERIFIED_CONTAM: hypothetical protein K2H54_065930 [Gekko kuhli]
MYELQLVGYIQPRETKTPTTSNDSTRLPFSLLALPQSRLSQEEEEPAGAQAAFGREQLKTDTPEAAQCLGLFGRAEDVA